jgi:predicted nucleotidyltransferase component of viral defense system
MGNLPEDSAIEEVFKAISLSEELRENLILKGGNALKYVYKSPRASQDLDFTTQAGISKQKSDYLHELLDQFCLELQKNLDLVLPKSIFVSLVVQSRKVLPPKKESPTFPAFEIKVGYSRVEQRTLPFNDIVKLEVTLNDKICEEVTYQVDGKDIKVGSLNDIIAEKLRALIQQITRNRSRPNDVFDIWFFHKNLGHLLDIDKISEFLLKKSEDKDVKKLVVKSTFQKNSELYKRASDEFDRVKNRVNSNIEFPTYDEAFDELLKIVAKLKIPD